MQLIKHFTDYESQIKISKTTLHSLVVEEGHFYSAFKLR